MRYILLIVMVLTGTFTFGQFRESEIARRTQIGSNQCATRQNNNRGLFLSCHTGYTVIDNQDAFLMGCKGGWSTSARLVFGIGGSFYINTARPNPQLGSVYDFEYNTEGAYGFLFGEWVLWPYRKIHITLPLNIGTGVASYVTDYYDYYNDEWMNEVVDSDNHFVIEPGIEAEFWMADFVKASLGVNYRLTSPLNISTTDSHNTTTHIVSPNAIRTISFTFALKLGNFKHPQ